MSASLIKPVIRCWSRSHDLEEEPTWSIPGERFCGKHAGESAGCAALLEQLSFVEDRITSWAQDPERHTDGAKLEVEGSIRGFLEGGLVDAHVRPGLRRSPGGEPQADFDVTVVMGETEQTPFRHPSYNQQVGQPPPHGHLEVSFRCGTARWSEMRQKIARDLEKLNRTIDDAIAGGHPKPWTALVLVGDGWANHHDDVCDELHALHQARSITSIPSARGTAGWWSCVDAVIMPGLLLKKHELYEQPDAASKAWPVWGRVPASSDDPRYLWRPLSVARAFLRHHLEILRGQSDGHKPVLKERERAAVMGPLITNRDLKPSTTWRNAQLASVLAKDGAPEKLFHAVDERATKFLAMMHEAPPRLHLVTCPHLRPDGMAQRGDVWIQVQRPELILLPAAYWRGNTAWR